MTAEIVPFRARRPLPAESECSISRVYRELQEARDARARRIPREVISPEPPPHISAWLAVGKPRS